MAGYVVQSPIRWGKSDGEVVELQPGDSLPSEFSEDQRNELLAAGSVVPAETYKSVGALEEKQKKLNEKQEELAAEQSALATEQYEVQQQAEDELAAAQAPPAPEPKAESKSEPKPAPKPAPKPESKKN